MPNDGEHNLPGEDGDQTPPDEDGEHTLPGEEDELGELLEMHPVDELIAPTSSPGPVLPIGPIVATEWYEGAGLWGPELLVGWLSYQERGDGITRIIYTQEFAPIYRTRDDGRRGFADGVSYLELRLASTGAGNIVGWGANLVGYGDVEIPFEDGATQIFAHYILDAPWMARVYSQRQDGNDPHSIRLFEPDDVVWFDVAFPPDFSLQNYLEDSQLRRRFFSAHPPLGFGAVEAETHWTSTYPWAARLGTVAPVNDDLVVNSTGDAAAEDAAVRGCDTGETVGEDDEPECTLRAALEAADARGGGEITFAIPGDPVIVLGSTLPVVEVPVTIDGTTQSGGVVEVVGGGAQTFSVVDGSATMSGLAIHGADVGIDISGGWGHVIEGNLIGYSRSGSVVGDLDYGVLLTGSSNSQVRDNSIAAQAGVWVEEGALFTDIEQNRIGVAGGDARYGVMSLGASVNVGENEIHTTFVGVGVLGAPGVTADGSAIVDNDIVVVAAQDSTAAGGIIVQGVPTATITGNTVESGGIGGIMLAGSFQAAIEESGDGLLNLQFFGPNTVLDTPVTGTGGTVSGNTIDAPTAERGILVWAGATNVTVSANTVSAAAQYGINVRGGEQHDVSDNDVQVDGTESGGGGIALGNVTSTTVSDNTAAGRIGVWVTGEGADITIARNETTGPGDEAFGIAVEGEFTNVVIDANSVTGAGSIGISAEAEGLRVQGNVVHSSRDGIAVDGDDVSIRDNHIGTDRGMTSFPGNSRHGIVVRGADATIRDNVVVNSAAVGILADDEDARITLRANRVWGSGTAGIDVSRSAPTISAAIIADTPETTRTTLVITEIPTETAGTIEIFANDSCAAGEARYLTNIIRDTTIGKDVRLIQLLSERDHFTIVYTDAEGYSTSLSSCESRTVYPDSDGDGSIDPLDELMGSDGDPTRAVIVSADEQLLIATVAPRNDALGINGGYFEYLRLADLPDEGALPDGWSMPHGAFAFRIAGLEPRGRAMVTFAFYDGDVAMQGESYWKYGWETPDSDGPSWFDFVFDEETMTGAMRTTGDYPGLGFRTEYTLLLVDGLRGDNDGALNGTISDPGGPVVFAGDTSDGGGGAPPPTETGATDRPLATTGGHLDSSILFGALLLVLLGVRLVSWRARPGRVSL